MKTALYLLLVALAAACASKKKDDNKPVSFMAAMPGGYQTEDKSFPVGQCLPLQIYVVDATTMKPVPSPADFTVKLIIKSVLAEDGTGDAQLHAYSDKDCTIETTTVSIGKASGDTAFSGVKIYDKAAAKGRTSIGMTADNAAANTTFLFTFN